MPASSNIVLATAATTWLLPSRTLTSSRSGLGTSTGGGSSSTRPTWQSAHSVNPARYSTPHSGQYILHLPGVTVSHGGAALQGLSRLPRPWDGLEDAALAVLGDRVPRKAAAVHGDVHSRLERLHECQRRPQVKHAVRTAKRVGHHGPGEHDRLAGHGPAEDTGGLLHSVGPVGDDDPVGAGGEATFEDQCTVRVGHLEAVDHHQRFDLDVQAAPPQPEHIGEVRVLEKKLPGQFVVFLVKRAAGHVDLDAM